ncbi:PREDICTED: deuterosome protein 1 isoform X3 [Sturnus vulgaris]|uniref:deuterosome protein 1 isoform X3 n=1 Tax=Sturnus vulgaris TaxID=9172 RepID=UPI00071A5897|nr:PREDICTED: deuterosome protein 1 isoform X3 [Sturnus vulgaris]
MEEDLEVFQEQDVTKASPCEAELQELVHQIDIMVNRKQVEWERKMRALEVKMDIQDQELASAQSKLDQKGQEVGLLQQELENLQKTKNEMAQSYESQLQALKSQDFKPKSQEWEKNGTTCVNNPVYADMQAKLLPEKCNLFQKQTQNYQLQICKKKQNQEEIITYIQPKSEHDDLIIEKLKAIVNEIARNKNKLVEENMKLHEDLKMYQNQCQNMEADVSEMRNELQSRDGLWRRIQLECQKLYTELLKIKEYEDMQEIQIKHQSSCVQLTEQLEDKNTELLLVAESREHQEELNKIRNHVYREEQPHCSEQERMKTEISDLTEELHQKEITIATIMKKASLLERQLKMELETKHKLLTKQQCIDLCNKEHGNFAASVHKMKHENLRLQNSLVKLQNDTETSILGCMDTYREMEHSYQTHSKMREKEERGHEKKTVYKSPLPPVGYPLGCHGPFPEVSRKGSFQTPAYNAEEIKLSSPPEMSFLATEKFLQEEEKHAREFEERLNSHLEELQRYSENTLKKYARMQQSRHT